MFRGDFQGAIASFRRALTVNPYYVWCLNDLAWVQWLTGDETGANRTLDRVLAISPGDEAAHSGKAGLYLLQGLLDEALVQIRAAESVNPGYFFVTMLLPAVLARRGDFEEAEACCRRALARDPHSFAGHASLGLVLAAAGRGSEAETSLGAALAIPPFYPPLSLNYAVLYDAAGWVPAAGRWVSKAIAEGVRITPDSTVHPRILTLYQQLT
jgi:tetratricopeptide (TPR) repeat protein